MGGEVGGVNLGLIAGPRENPRMKGCSSVILDHTVKGTTGMKVPQWGWEQGFPHGIAYTRAMNFL